MIREQCAMTGCHRRADPDSEEPGLCRRHGAQGCLPAGYVYVDESIGPTVAQVRAAGGTPRWVVDTRARSRHFGLRVPLLRLAAEREVTSLLVLAYNVSATVEMREITVIRHLYAHRDRLVADCSPNRYIVDFVPSAVLVLAAAMNQTLKLKWLNGVRVLPEGLYEAFIDLDGVHGWHRVTCDTAQALDTERRLLKEQPSSQERSPQGIRGAAYEIAAWHVKICLNCGGRPKNWNS